MKEHFSTINVNSQKDIGALNINANRKAFNPSQVSTEPQAKETLTAEREDDWSGASLGPAGPLDFDSIEGMDAGMALESSLFIREMARTTNGRSMMSRAHKPVTPEKVIQLFDIA
ncbi:MAG: hypothetical protein GY950_01640 [bacterium]|nr:hypothetical protein [bacterium]